MARSSLRTFLRALAAPIAVAAGCSATTAPPDRPTGSVGQPPQAKATRAQADASLPQCPDPAPPPGRDPSKPMFVLQNGHERPIDVVSLSHDGSKLASGSSDTTVRIWDLRAGLLLHKFMTSGDLVQRLSLSADGKRLAYSVPEDEPEGLTVHLVDLDHPRGPDITLPHHWAFQLSPDGKWLAASLTTLDIFDAKTGKRAKKLVTGARRPNALELAWDAEGRRVAVAHVGQLIVVDVTTDKVTHSFDLSGRAEDTPWRLALAGDLAILLDTGGKLTLYPLGKHAKPRVLPGQWKEMVATNGRIWVTDDKTKKVAAFSLPDAQPIPLSTQEAPRGDFLAASGDDATLVLAQRDGDAGTKLDVRDAQTMRAVRSIEGIRRPIEAIAVRPDGTELVTGSALGELARWDLRTGTQKPALPDGEATRVQILGLAYAPSGEQFAAATNTGRIRVREAESGRLLRQWNLLEGSIPRFLSFLPASDELVTVRVKTIDRGIEIGPDRSIRPIVIHDVAVERWDLRGPKPPWQEDAVGESGRPPGKVLGKLAADAWYFALSQDGQHLVVGSNDGVTSLRTDTGTIDWTTKLPKVPGGVTKRPDGGMKLRDARAAFSPDGKTLVVSVRQLQTRAQHQQFVPVLLEIDAATGQVRKTHEPGTNGVVQWYKGAIVVAGSEPAVLDASTFAVRARLAVPANRFNTITVDPKRDLFVLGGEGGAAAFASERGEVVMTLVTTQSGEWVAAAGNGAYRSSLDGARSIAWAFTDPLEAFSLERFASRFERPDLIERSLAGGDAKAPALLARPPQLRVETKGPRGRIETAEKSLSLDALATSPSRVDRVRVFVDGKPTADRLVCAANGRVSLDVPLHAGTNRVSVVAYDAAGYASNPEQLDVVSTSP